MKGKGREEVLFVTSFCSQKKPKFKKRKRNVLGANKVGGQTETKGKKVQDMGNCYFCGKKRHWKRNCPNYLRSFKGKRLDGQDILPSMRVIEINLLIGRYPIS